MQPVNPRPRVAPLRRYGRPAGQPGSSTATSATSVRLRSPEDLLRSGLKACLRSDAVGDRPVVAGDYGRGVVDLVDEHGEGAGDAGLAGGFEGDGDRGGGEGDG